MRQLSATGRRATIDLGRQHGFSSDGVAVMLEAVVAGNGRMAQFDHRDFGGSGQWMRGGMTMVADMFDSALKGRVERLCDEISRLITADEAFFEKPTGVHTVASDWWPPELGLPQSAGAQNGMRYAYFSTPQRLAIERRGEVMLYDTLDHQIDGVSQQQGDSGSLAFTSQRGAVDIEHLPIVTALGVNRAPAGEPSDTVTTIERLADLHARGILDDQEFATKKAELLRRI